MDVVLAVLKLLHNLSDEDDDELGHAVEIVFA